jgi:uncharacterized coiled-coil DUF342 family protein
MGTIAKEMELLIHNFRVEIDCTNKHFQLMLELRKEVVDEYDILLKQYKDIRIEIENDAAKLLELKKELKKVQKISAWSGPYPLRPLKQNRKDS